jgi:hypothetical protein
MTSQLSKMKAAGVETVVVWAQGTPMGLLLRSMEKINYCRSSWPPRPPTTSPSTTRPARPWQGAPSSCGPSSTRIPRHRRSCSSARPKLAAPSAFIFAMQGYDSTQLLAAAMRQAGGTEGRRCASALENLQAPVQGVYKTYNKPFSRTQREGLTPADARWVHWDGDKLAEFSDARHEIADRRRHQSLTDHADLTAAGPVQRADGRQRLCAHRVGLQRDLRHHPDAELLAWGLRLRGRIHRSRGDVRRHGHSAVVHHFQRRPAAVSGAVARAVVRGSGDGADRLAAVPGRSTAVRRASRHGLGHEHPGFRRHPAKHRNGHLGSEVRGCSRPFRHRRGPRVRRGHAAAGDAHSRSRHHGDAGLRPRHAQDHDRQGHARRSAQAGSGGPHGHQRRCHDGRRVRGEFRAWRDFRASCSRRSRNSPCS